MPDMPELSNYQGSRPPHAWRGGVEVGAWNTLGIAAIAYIVVTLEWLGFLRDEIALPIPGLIGKRHHWLL